MCATCQQREARCHRPQTPHRLCTSHSRQTCQTNGQICPLKPVISCARPARLKRVKPMGRCRKRTQPMAQKRALRHSYPPRAQQSGSGNVSPTRVMSGAPGAIRTRDTRFRRAVLYPLSYGGGYVAGRAGTRASASELLFYATCSTSSRRARAPPHRGDWQAARGASWDSD